MIHRVRRDEVEGAPGRALPRVEGAEDEPRDARVLTQRRGQDPDSWPAVRTNLPLLAQERYFTTLKRGYARGWEPVGFVRKVQTYAELLRWMVADEPPSAPSGEEAAK